MDSTIDSSIDSDWSKVVTDENEYKKGLVIEDEIGNQFVWVGVDDTNVKFERKDYVGTKMSQTFDIKSEEYTLMEESVLKNEGFYIARYEAGVPTKLGIVSINSHGTVYNGTIKPISKKGYGTWNYIPWGVKKNGSTPGNGAIIVARSMYPTTDNSIGVNSTLCYDIEWDTALEFISLTDDAYAKNSTNKGNYTGKMALTGDKDSYKLCNIYDMAGNNLEWTMGVEKDSDNGIVRGGLYRNSGSNNPSGLRQYYSFDNRHQNFAFRVALYIR